MKEGETIELYPKGGLMVINSDKLRDKETGDYVQNRQTQTKDVCKGRLEEKEQKNKDAETISRGSKEKDRITQKIKEHEEDLPRKLQTIWRLEKEVEERRKPVLDEKEKIYFFPKWKALQGVIRETEEKEQYMTVGEDGRSRLR